MLTMQLPTLLAVLGTVLMAIVIFAPAPVAASVTTSFAPPLPPPLDHWSVPTFSTPPIAGEAFDEPPFTPPEADATHAATAPEWPALVDSAAGGCDALARRSLVEALAAVRTPWADAILRRAEHEETDPLVLEALRNLERAAK